MLEFVTSSEPVASGHKLHAASRLKTPNKGYAKHCSLLGTDAGEQGGIELAAKQRDSERRMAEIE
jgi:hypothetical protein